jgi:hypothetical protein
VYFFTGILCQAAYQVGSERELGTAWSYDEGNLRLLVQIITGDSDSGNDQNSL